jgi:glycosyltransferase involved in cell wall biosynthesis
MKTNPLISVLLSVHNADAYIKDAIDSITEQSYTNWELIIIDDGSTDLTPTLLQQYNHPKIKIISQKNKGLTASLNRAASMANGELLARQDADDLSHKDRFKLQVEQFLSNKEIILVSSKTAWIDSHNKLIDFRDVAINRSQAIKKMSDLTNPYVHGSLMFKKTAFDAISGYNENLSTSQDFDLIVRMSSLEKEFAAVSKTLYYLRVHRNTITAKKWIKQIFNTMKCARMINHFHPNRITYRTRLIFIIKKMITGFLSIYNPEFIYDLRKLRQQLK